MGVLCVVVVLCICKKGWAQDLPTLPSWPVLQPFVKAVDSVIVLLVVQTSTDHFNSINHYKFCSANPLNFKYDMTASHVYSFPVISYPHTQLFNLSLNSVPLKNFA